MFTKPGGPSLVVNCGEQTNKALPAGQAGIVKF